MTEMDDVVRDSAFRGRALRGRAGGRRSTRVISRTGDPSNPDDLELVNIGGARSVIVLRGDQGDAGMVKTVLAIRSLDPLFERGHVVVEVADPRHAETLEMLTDGAVVPVNADEVIAEVMAQACHQDGLSYVFRELMDFDGDEIYFADIPELAGHSYSETLLAFERSSVIGRLSKDGVVELNPAPTVMFEAGDQVIVVAQDENHLAFTGFVEVDLPPPPVLESDGRHAIRVLVIGWSSVGPRVLHQLDEFAAAGSHIEVAIDPTVVADAGVEQIRLRKAELRVTCTGAGPEYLVGRAQAAPFDQIIVLGYRETLDTAHADARTLLTLLTLRKLWPSDARPRVRIIGEILDQSNLEIATTTGADDIIVSDVLTGLMIAQLSERAELQAVFADLFQPRGATVEFQPANRYVPDGPCSFATVVAAGVRGKVSVIGYRIPAERRTVVNPPKSEPVQLSGDDQVLVIRLRRPAPAPAA